MMESVRIGVIGAGRIGSLHANLIARQVSGARVVAVADVNAEAAARVASAVGAEARDVDELITSDDVDAVAVCSSTDMHMAHVLAAVEARKAIFCEKPLSLSLAEVDQIIAAVEEAEVPFMMGFNRRFDPGHRSVRDAVVSGQIGEPHVVRITSRDPEPPPIEYVKVSGGLFKDMMIHDFDMASYLVQSPVQKVYAVGAVRVDPAIGAAGDVDTAVVVLTHADGTVTTIDNSRSAKYGYDQRVEVFGSLGMAASDNRRIHGGSLHTASGISGQPLQNFFLERYAESYVEGWRAFVDYLSRGGPSPAPVTAARLPLVLADAAARSAASGLPVRPGEES